jgi:hypothetical protein
MLRTLSLAAAVVSLALPAFGAEVIEPVSKRFAAEDVQEVPDFRTHVAPMLGRLGCNSRSCHGSFQGRGGLRLSLFGFDFKMDHDNLATGEDSRVNLETPADSLMLLKPISDEFGHGGGHRLDEGSWEHRLLLNWIKTGAKPAAADHADLTRLEVSPTEIVFSKQGQTRQLRVIAHWSDGSKEDVTPLSRFQTNSGQVAEINKAGLVTAAEPGDTHLVVFYDAAVVPIPVMRPVTNQVGPNYPDVPAPTRIDVLVVEKLRKLGIVPSELSNDAQFLRRVSLDLTGTLPTAAQVETFLADSSANKRTRKIDELLQTPGYVAWWTTRLCDITGNNDDNLNNVVPIRGRASQDWYDWIHKRVADNVPYDELVSGIVTAVSRNEGESFTEYSKAMSSLYNPDSKESYSEREHMPHYWARRTFRQPTDRAIGFAYTFLGIRIQCAQCHKHPFDQWTQQDFQQFTGFFTRVSSGTNPASRDEYDKLQKALGLEGKKGNQLRRELPRLLKKGKTVPFQEVYAIAPRRNANNGNNNKAALKRLKQQVAQLEARVEKFKEDGNKKQLAAAQKQSAAAKQRVKRFAAQANKRRNGQGAATAKLLGGDVIKLTEHADARQPLMQWLRDPNNGYFARAFVNRVWANYFNVGIVEPPDDLSLANPPSNKPLLDYLTQGFIDNGYDMKWLHREITRSRTYQLSWQPNDTNIKDELNFSHAVPRRLPAEIAYDALKSATASDANALAMHTSMEGRAIAIPGAGTRRNATSYALQIFGRSIRDTNCDCDRSSDSSLLQTVFLRNDNEVLTMIDNGRDSWLSQVNRELTGKPLAGARNTGNQRGAANIARAIANQKRRIAQARKDGNDELVKRLTVQLKRYKSRGQQTQKPQKRRTEEKATVETKPSDAASLVRQAYLRTLSRYPSETELSRSVSYLDGEENIVDGLRGLMWALINTKEFIVNH